MLRLDCPTPRWASLFGFVLSVSYAQAAWANGIVIPPPKPPIVAPPLKVDPKPNNGNLDELLRLFVIRRDPTAKQARLLLPKSWLTTESGIALGDSLKLGATGPRTSTIVSGIALSLAVTIGGIAVFGGRGRTVVLKYGVYLLGLVVATCGGYASANMASPGGPYGRPLGPQPLPTGLQAPLLPSSIAYPPRLPSTFMQTPSGDEANVVFRAPVVIEFVEAGSHGTLILDGESSWLSGGGGLGLSGGRDLKVGGLAPTLPLQLQTIYKNFERLHPNLKE
jgi:hypothetical protein